MTIHLLAAWAACLAVFTLTLLLAPLVHAAPRGDLDFRQMHHAYLSVPLVLTGAVLGWPLLLGVALVLAFDDAEEHLVQLVTGDLVYQSPVHRLWYGTLGAWTPLVQLGHLLDRLLGRVP